MSFRISAQNKFDSQIVGVAALSDPRAHNARPTVGASLLVYANFRRADEGIRPYEWCTSVGLRKKPTLLERAWKPAPTGLQFTVAFAQNPTLLGRFVNRPYGGAFRRLVFAKFERARADEGAGVRWTPLSEA